jgi:hypothetical protein
MRRLLARPRTLAALAMVAAIALLSCMRRIGPSTPTWQDSAAGGMAVGGESGPTKPVPRGPRIDHAKHLGKGLECVDCHMKDLQGADALEPRMPTYAACADCHDDEDKDLPPEKKIKNVFFKPDGSPVWERAIEDYPPEIRFVHAPHAKAKCADCHADVLADPPGPRKTGHLFTMEGCIQCHTKRGAPTRCETCHKELRSSVPPPSHHTDWISLHGNVAKEGPQVCARCHSDPQFCDRCHQTTMPASHASPDWHSIHGALALSRQVRCEMCHADPQFCDRCHQVTPPDSHRHLWIERHGAEARTAFGRKQNNCQLCHHDPTFCERCHQLEPPRSHTYLFRTRTHGVMAAMDRRSCQVCHDTDFCIRCHEGTPPRSHHGMWASGLNTHCANCHFPLSSEQNCRVCHFEQPTHSTAPDMPPWHTPALNCRMCHNTAGGGGAPPLKHYDNGMQCTFCHH